MTWSLGEIEGLALKAARGAGYSWGLAEDAGRAVRVLAAYDLPGPGMLATLLSTHHDTLPEARMPVSLDPPLRAAAGTLCPIGTGAAICDLAGTWDEIALGPTACPLLLLPFVISASRHTGAPIAVVWDDALCVTDGDSLGVSGEALRATRTDAVRLGPGDTLADPRYPAMRGRVAESSATVLQAFAARTYAPATEASRTSGAGAGTSDND